MNLFVQVCGWVGGWAKSKREGWGKKLRLIKSSALNTSKSMISFSKRRRLQSPFLDLYLVSSWLSWFFICVNVTHFVVICAWVSHAPIALVANWRVIGVQGALLMQMSSPVPGSCQCHTSFQSCIVLRHVEFECVFLNDVCGAKKHFTWFAQFFFRKRWTLPHFGYFFDLVIICTLFPRYEKWTSDADYHDLSPNRQEKTYWIFTQKCVMLPKSHRVLSFPNLI